MLQARVKLATPLHLCRVCGLESGHAHYLNTHESETLHIYYIKYTYIKALVFILRIQAHHSHSYRETNAYSISLPRKIKHFYYLVFIIGGVGTLHQSNRTLQHTPHYDELAVCEITVYCL